jgi:hypothetical protein
MRASRASAGNGAGDGGFGDHDPLVLGLFRKLPEPDEDWPAKDRLKWLQTGANIFDLVYKGRRRYHGQHGRIAHQEAMMNERGRQLRP